jgi:hypothetical protein
MCGRRLLPFSLAHSMLLRALGNPYAYVAASATREDLLAAVLVCSRTREQNRSALFGGRMRTGPLLRWSWRWRKMNLAIADASLRQYIADHTRFPAYIPLADAPGVDAAPVAPIEFHLHRHLCADRGWDDAAAWDCGYSYARHLFDCWAEAQGHKALASEIDVQLAEMDKAQREAHERGDAAERDRIFAEMGALTRKAKGARRG